MWDMNRRYLKNGMLYVTSCLAKSEHVQSVLQNKVLIISDYRSKISQ